MLIPPVFTKQVLLDELQDLVCMCVFYPQIRDVVERELNT